MNLLGIGSLISGIGSIAGSIFSANSADDAADAQMEMLRQQLAEARRIREENKGLANDAYNQIIGLVDKQPNIQSFLDEGTKIGESQMEYRKKYILGDTEDDIRSAQGQNAKLAAFDFAGLNSNLTKILQNSELDIASIAESSGAPIGTFANLSVANMANLAAQGLENTINIGDYLGRVSGIDQFNPYRIAQDLFKVEEAKMHNKIEATNNRVSAITGNNNQWFANFSDISNAQMVVEANRANSLNQAIQAGISGVAGTFAGLAQQQTLGRQQAFYDTLLTSQKYGGIPQAIPVS